MLRNEYKRIFLNRQKSRLKRRQVGAVMDREGIKEMDLEDLYPMAEQKQIVNSYVF